MSSRLQPEAIALRESFRRQQMLPPEGGTTYREVPGEISPKQRFAHCAYERKGRARHSVRVAKDLLHGDARRARSDAPYLYVQGEELLPMTTWTLVFRSLRFHARSHLGALLGSLAGSAVLVGALIVGDSVRGSLRAMALARLGETQSAIASNDRFFRSELAANLAPDLSAFVVPGLQLLGTARTADSSARANRVQVLGITSNFWHLRPSDPKIAELNPGEVILNSRLTEQLNVKAGDTILLRVPKPSQLSRDAPLSPQEDTSLALRLNVAGIVSAEDLGHFSLQASQIAPFNAFVSLTWFQKQLNLEGRANLLLVGKSEQNFAAAAAILRQKWNLPDAELELRDLPAPGGVELRSSRVFLDTFVARAALGVSTNAQGVLTYFVNDLRSGNESTPYSMVTATGSPIVPPDMRDDEVLVNQWLADDLKCKPDDSLEITYFTVGSMRKLEEQKARFQIRAVLPMSGPAVDRSLMPDFPGLTDAENCRDWDAGFEINTERIRAQDQKYWDEYRGTPKAFITLAAGQRLWSNRFGNLTAVRYPPGTDKERLAQTLLASLDPGAFGLVFQPVLAQALAASSQSQDFGQLFLGFSFFLILAALLLMALMFQFGVERRANEIGALLAVGFTQKLVRRLLLLEGAALAFVGGILGLIGGIWYAKAMLYGLSTIWRSAIGTAGLSYSATPQTLFVGAAASMIVALLTIWIALRRQARQPAPELLAEGAGLGAKPFAGKPAKVSRGLWIGAATGILAMLILGSASFIGLEAGGFFGAGALLLASGLGFLAAFLSSFSSSTDVSNLRLFSMGLRNSARRRNRSLATLGLLACGSFLIMSIGVFRLDADADATKRSSGTGGFALVGETSAPINHDLNSDKDRLFLGLDDPVLKTVDVVPLRVREGDDASCLNLNRAQKPRLIGVQPELLDKRSAFTFAKVASGMPNEHPWLLLKRSASQDEVPAIGDQASIQWALGKKVGDILEYMDERGQVMKVRLVASVANSILQGNLLIDEEAFKERFPTEAGYRMFLIDAPSNHSEIAAALSRGLQDSGMELVSSVQRLAAFNAVQNTYLNTFQVLGGLGLLLGSVGLGVVVLRNVLERRGELGLLLAVGFRPRSLKWLVLSEHGALLVLGLGVGVGAALVAVLPALLSPRGQLPYVSLAATLGAVLVSGALWTWLATWLALRGRLLDALRND